MENADLAFIVAAVLLPIVAGVYHYANRYGYHGATKQEALLESLAVCTAIAAIMSVLMVIVTAFRYMG